MSILRSPSALLNRYREQYRLKPHSRVFAPLAEAYRKLGMRDEALNILKEGIRRHPTYALGYLVLAQCYADDDQWDRVHQTLQPLAPTQKDNPALQKLFAQACLKTADTEGAIETLKWLLFLNPRDKDIAQQVKALEDDQLSSRHIVPREAVVKAPASFDTNEDDWAMQDFSPQIQSPVSTQEDAPIPGKADDWHVMSRALDDDFFSDEEVSPEDSPDLEPTPEVSEAAPLVSHTLVDLYLAQNHRAEAMELLERYVAADPRDERSRQRLRELRNEKIEMTEGEGEEELLRLVQANVHSPDQERMEKVLKLFLEQVHVAAREHKEAHALPRR